MHAEINNYLDSLKNEARREDSERLLKIFAEESGYKAKLHGSMIGFGMYHYKYDSGREGDFFVTGFAPRAQHLALYIMPGFAQFQKELDQLGKHKTARSCLYIKRLSDVDEKVLRRIISKSVKIMNKTYPCRAA